MTEEVEPTVEEQALAFVNNVRTRMELPTLAEMPEPTGNVGRMTSAGLALNCCVCRHGGNGHLYALLDEDKERKLYAILVELECRAQNRVARVNRDPSKGYLVELHLPRYLYDYAAPRQMWLRAQEAKA